MKINLFKLSKPQKTRLKKNIFSNISAESLQVISQLAYPPLMILFWGIESFGIWIFFTSIPTMFYLLNINFNFPVTQEMTMFHSKGNKIKVEETFQNGLALAILSTLVYLTIAFGIYFFFGLDFSAVKSLSNYEINLILLIVIVAFSIDLLKGIFVTGIAFQGKQYIEQYINSAFNIISKLTIAFSGIFFESLIYIAIIFLMFTICKFLIYYYYFIINKQYLVLSFKKVSLKKISKLLKLSIGNTLEALHHLIKHHGLIILLGIFSNPQIIAYVSTCKTLFYFFPTRIIIGFQNIALFEYAQTFAKKKFNTLKHNHIGSILLVSAILLIFIIGSLAIGPVIYGIWLNHEFDLSYVLLLLIVTDVSIYILKLTITVIMKSINKYIIINLFEFFSLSILMIISYLLLSMGYSFLSYFVMMIINSSIVFIFSIYLTINFYKKLV